MVLVRDRCLGEIADHGDASPHLAGPLLAIRLDAMYDERGTVEVLIGLCLCMLLCTLGFMRSDFEKAAGVFPGYMGGRNPF
jgi:hypothetical protein